MRVHLVECELIFGQKIELRRAARRAEAKSIESLSRLRLPDFLRPPNPQILLQTLWLSRFLRNASTQGACVRSNSQIHRGISNIIE